MSRERIAIKGTSDGIIVSIGAGDWNTLLTQLATQLSQRAAFFKGGRVALSVGNRLLDAAQIEAAGNLLATHQMTLWAVNSDAPETRDTTQIMGLESAPTIPVLSPPLPLTETSNPTGLTTTVQRTFRSGQSLEVPGNVVIIGDVNPGAKIIAGGYVIVWGRLRGTVYAGGSDPQKAFVCALELSPIQLVIGNMIARSPANNNPADIVPEIAFVQDGLIVAEAWR